MKRSTGAIFVLAALSAATGGSAAELPALHATPDKSAETPGESGAGFDIPGSGLHVTFGGYIEGAVVATAPKHAAAAPAIRHRPTP